MIKEKEKKCSRYWPKMFIQGVSLRYTPVQYGLSLLSFSIVNPWFKHWFWASNQLCGTSSAGLISDHKRKETKLTKVEYQ